MYVHPFKCITHTSIQVCSVTYRHLYIHAQRGTLPIHTLHIHAVHIHKPTNSMHTTYTRSTYTQTHQFHVHFTIPPNWCALPIHALHIHAVHIHKPTNPMHTTYTRTIHTCTDAHTYTNFSHQVTLHVYKKNKKRGQEYIREIELHMRGMSLEFLQHLRW